MPSRRTPLRSGPSHCLLRPRKRELVSNGPLPLPVSGGGHASGRAHPSSSLSKNKGGNRMIRGQRPVVNETEKARRSVRRAFPVGVTGLEPATLCSQSRCASQLRHTPGCGSRRRGGNRGAKVRKKMSILIQMVLNTITFRIFFTFYKKGYCNGQGKFISLEH